ncbi:hypothetical protein SDC9_162554 [bioreactor metagenome]|uniref:Uncharacterized protein n=1 Tax=bioreactor metagenome TaxID=1076179 RepID=A0A645FSR9_9ZZZZ
MALIRANGLKPEPQRSWYVFTSMPKNMLEKTIILIVKRMRKILLMGNMELINWQQHGMHLLIGIMKLVMR